MSHPRPSNLFLAQLPDPTWRRLSPELKEASLPLNAAIYRPGERVTSVYFPTGALLSQVNRSSEGQGVETAMVGLDGASGMIETMGSGHSIWESQVQVDGPALVAPAAAVRRLAWEDAKFMAACWRLAELQALESQQSVLCQALHGGERRLARWLLEARDRAGGRNPLPLTQEMLAAMLGVQRTTVTAFQAQLQNDGLISCRRGRVEIVDHARLETRACGCRNAVRRRREELGLEPAFGAEV